MENVAWIVVPSGEALSTFTVSLSALLENKSLLKRRPLWIHLRRIDELSQDLLTEEFKINELSIEDCKTEERSKVENFEDYLFFLFVYYDGGISREKKLCVFWGRDFIITVGSRRLFEQSKKNLFLEDRPFDKGTEKVFWIIASLITDKFKHITDLLEEEGDEIEAKVFKEQNPELLEDISDLSYEILTLRRALKQLRDSFKLGMSYCSRFSSPENVHYFRDLLDEISILYDRAETLHEFIQNVLNVFSSLVSFKLNEVMKTLTIFVAVLEPLMFISSFYGMNVENLPFAQKPYGIILVSAFMFLVSAGLIYYFKKKKWL